MSAPNDAAKTAQPARDALLWIELLLRQFPELLAELAPAHHSPSAPPPADPVEDEDDASSPYPPSSP
ncbi:hypothetical protein AB0L31_15575, partial [Streptomyces sp. NPDC052535]